jgi:hypothetical protein
LPGDSKNSTVDGQSQLTPCGHEQTFPTYLTYLPNSLKNRTREFLNNLWGLGTE